MAAAKLQQANGAKKCENGRPKTVRNRHPKSAKTSENGRKRSKTSENRRKSARTIGVFFVDRFLAIFQWPYSGGHLGFPQKSFPIFWDLPVCSVIFLIFAGIPPICPLPVSQPIENFNERTCKKHFRKSLEYNQDLSRQKWETPPVWEILGLPSFNWSSY